MDYQVNIAHHVEELGQSAWDQLSSDRPFASYRWYRFAEMVLTDEVPTYLVVTNHGEPLARATFWLTRQEPLPISSPVMRALVQAVLRRWPLLVCRAPLSSASGLIVADDPSVRDSIVTTIVRTAQDLVRQNHAAIGLFDYLEQHEASWAGWSPDFVAAAMPSLGTRLEITWPDFDSYMQQLPKSVQKDYRRHRNRAADLGIVVTTDDTPPPIGEALQLIHNVERHHHSAPNPWTEQILRHANLIDGSWLKATIGDRLVGCGSVMGDGRTRFLGLLGLDYEVQYVYFQLLYSAIQCAIETGTRGLRGGTSVYDIKQRLGFQLESNNHVRYSTNNRLIGWLARRFA